MHQVSLQQAVKMTEKSESTLRRDVKKGKVSAERDARGHLKFDPAELRRVYGELKSPGEDAQSTEKGNDKALTGHDNPQIIALLENQVADLKAQLTQASDRETTLQNEKSKLLDMLSAEQEKTRVLMLPNAEQAERKGKGWLLRLIGAR